jgi:hypothetical protein
MLLSWLRPTKAQPASSKVSTSLHAGTGLELPAREDLLWDYRPQVHVYFQPRLAGATRKFPSMRPVCRTCAITSLVTCLSILGAAVSNSSSDSTNHPGRNSILPERQIRELCSGVSRSIDGGKSDALDGKITDSQPVHFSNFPHNFPGFSTVCFVQFVAFFYNYMNEFNKV